MDHRELKILEALDERPESSQRSLAKDLGIALGMTNILLKKMITKGWVHLNRSGKNRMAYNLTDEGISARMRMVFETLEDTVHFYAEARTLTRLALNKLKEKGVKKIAINGTSNVSEIIYLTAREAKIDVACAVDDSKHGERWMDLRCAKLDDLNAIGVEYLVLDFLKLNDVNHFLTPEGITAVSLRPE